MNQLKPIAHIKTDFPAKFGIPRQSGLVEELEGMVVMEPEYREPEAFRGLEGFTHVWLIWHFSRAERKTWSPTVRPPRLGGNRRVGVFATRSPFRPNFLGLSAVRLTKIDPAHPKFGPVLYVAGADLMDGTPVFDIKPYVPHTDCRPDALGGFSEEVRDYRLDVEFPAKHLARIPPDRRKALIKVLEQDPRPAYQSDPERVYGFEFSGFEVKFTVRGGLLQVCMVREAGRAADSDD